MPQITFIAHEHYDNIRVRVISELFQPSLHILIGLMLADIIDQQGPNGSPIVGRSDGAIAFLACGVPDLSFDGLGVDLDGAGCELDPDSRLAVEIEFVAGEAGEQVRFSNAGISN